MFCAHYKSMKITPSFQIPATCSRSIYEMTKGLSVTGLGRGVYSVREFFRRRSGTIKEIHKK